MAYGYPNSFGMGGLNYYNPQQYPQPKGINGRMVTGVEEARAAQIDLDGSQWYFPSPSEGKIYVKSINMQGMPIFQEYKLHNYEQKQDSSQLLQTLSQRIDELEELMCETIKTLEYKCPHIYKMTLVKLHTLAFGNHFDDELAEEAVSVMHNIDGTIGEHWKRSDTDEYAKQYNIDCKADFYVAMNMMYSDYSDILGNDASLCARMAKNYLKDPDASEGRLVMNYLWS